MHERMALMVKTGLLHLFLGSTLFICAPSFAQDVVIPLLTNSVSSSGHGYRCEQMVRSVNILRHLGKDQALRLLEADSHEHPQHDFDIMYICRLLFENPKGWRPIGGAAMYGALVHTNILDQFPLFPLTLSDGVPFYIFEGYNLGGRISESAYGCCKLCEGFPMIAADLSDANFETAARDLIKSEAFRKLYLDPGESSKMADMVLDQAGAKNHLTNHPIDSERHP
jgi:hypothetical protein